MLGQAVSNARFGVARGKYHRTPRAVVRTIKQRSFDAITRHGEYYTIGLFRQRGNRGITQRITDFVVARIDTKDFALKPRQIGNGARTDRGRIGRRAVNRDALRVE